MKKRVLFIFIFIILFITNVKADTGDSKNEALNIEYGRKYVVSWNNNDNSYYYNKLNISKKGILELNFSKPYNEFLEEYDAVEIYIYDSNSNVVWNTTCDNSKNNELTYYTFNIGLNSGTYYVRFKPAFEVKSNEILVYYQFNFEANDYAEVEPNEMLERATNVTLNHFYDAYFGNDGSNESENYDYLSFDLVEGDTYKFYNEDIWNDTNITINLYKPSNTQISISEWQEDDEGRHYFPFTADTTGTYYVKLSNYKNIQKKYRIAIFNDNVTVDDDFIKVESATSADNAVNIDFTKKYQTKWSGASFIYNKIVLNNNGIVEVRIDKTTDASNNIFELHVCKENGEIIQIQKLTASNLVFDGYYKYNIGLESGTYYIIIFAGSTSKKTNYSIRFNQTNYTEIEPNETADDATTLSLNHFYRCFYGNNGTYDNTYERNDFYKFDLVAGETYRIYNSNIKNENVSLNTVIFTLQLPNGKTTSFYNMKNDNPNGNSYINFPANETGTYYLKVYNYNGLQLQYDLGVFSTNLNNATVSGITDKVYTGYEIYQDVSVKLYGGTLRCDNFCNYFKNYSNNINVGTATLTIKGAPSDGYSGTITKTFKINPANINSVPLTTPSKVLYSGNNTTLPLTFKFNDETLTEGVDYKVTYENNNKIGTAKAIITGMGNFTGTKTKTFTIVTRSISNAKIDGLAPKTYTGKAQTQSLTLTYNGATLKNGVDYTISYKDNLKAGTASVTITGMGNFTGTVTKKFIINPRVISSAKIVGLAPKTYNGQEQKQTLTLTYNGMTLKENTDYQLLYSDNYDAGVATVSIIGIGNYKGTVDKAFRINPVSITETKITGLAARIYNGYAQEQYLTVKYKDWFLSAGDHYRITYKNNINVGVATVTITGIGNFKGSVSKQFRINRASLNSLSYCNKSKITVIKDVEYNGNFITMPITIYIDKDCGIKNGNLKEGVDYTVTYKNNKYVGTATITITGIGNYSSKIIQTFSIRPKKTTITKSTHTSNSITLYWNKISSQISHYEIIYSLNKNFNGCWGHRVGSKTTSYTLGGLTKGKTYFVRVETCKEIGNTTYCSPSTNYETIKLT